MYEMYVPYWFIVTDLAYVTYMEQRFSDVGIVGYTRNVGLHAL